MTRNEEYLNTIITALGGDPTKIPPYTFESEDNLAYLAKAFEGVTPGGGGGVLVIHETVSGNTHTLDKTWKQIADAIDSGVLPYAVIIDEVGKNIIKNIFIVDSVAFGSGRYIVGVNDNGYATTDENGYPSFSE